MSTPDQAQPAYRSSDSNDHITSAERETDRRVMNAPERTATTAGAHRPALDRRTVLDREKQRYGGVKIGAAFFGWLTATGTAVILTAVLAAAGTALGLANDVDSTAGPGTADSRTLGIVGGVALLPVLLVSYFCGGYVAGRMARFNGAKQGLAVWLWAVAIAVVVAVAGALAGRRFDILARLNGFPRLPINEGTVSTAGLIATIVIAAAALAGAILGGLAGMRFHRKVDKAGLGSH